MKGSFREKAERFIKYGNKKIVITRDIMQTLSGVLLIISSLLLSGLSAFISVGFDASKILTVGFWVSYAITLTMEWLCFFGVYTIREGQDKKQPKILINNQKRRDFREMIVKNKKIDSCENWLKIYNYEKKVIMHREILLEMYRKLNLIQPDKTLDHNSSRYKKQEKRYKRNCEKRDYLKVQFAFCDVHEQIVKKLRENNLAGAEELKRQLNEDDSFKCSRAKWRDVYFNDLFSGSTARSSQTIFYNRSKALFDNIKYMFVFGVCMTVITTAIILQRNEIGLTTIWTIVMNLATLCGYSLMGIRVADNIEFDIVYPANENRLTICDQFKEDDEKIHDKWVDLDLLDDNEAERQEDDKYTEAIDEKINT